jgi:acyl-ACP thioesterase
MNNLKYVNVAIDAFSSAFYKEHPVRELELEYLGQCHEGDIIDVYRTVEDGHADVLARNGAGETVLKAVLSY